MSCPEYSLEERRCYTAASPVVRPFGPSGARRVIRTQRHCARRYGSPLRESGLRLLRRIVVGDGAPGCAVEIVILAALQRPEEGRETGQTERQRQRDEDDEDLNQAPSSRKAVSVARRDSVPVGLTSVPALRARSALSITRMEEPDIAAAAIRGVTMP